VLGGVVLGAAVLQEVVSKNWRQGLQFVAVGCLSAAVALLNPFGFDIYREVWYQATYPNDQLIAEWVAPPFLMQSLVVLFVLMVLGLMMSVVVKRKVFWGSLVVLFAIMALTARRHLSLFGLVTGLALLHAACHPLRAWLRVMKPRRLLNLRLLWGVGLVVAIMVVGIVRVPRTLAVSTQWDKYCTAAQVKYPCGAVEWLKENPLEVTNVFNAYEWGGFLEWQLPEYKYFVDGRMPAFATRASAGKPAKDGGVLSADAGKSPYTIYLELIQARDGYEQRLEDYGAEALFIQTGTFLDLKLQQNENKNSSWLEAYRDGVAVIYERASL